MSKNKIRTFIIKAFLFSLPFLFAASLFIYYDPYDYWGIFNDQRGFHTSYSPLPRLRYFLNHKENCDTILLGDSRSEGLRNERLSELAHAEAINLAASGQSLNESIDTFWFTVENAPSAPVKHVYFQLSFYGMNATRVTHFLPEVINLSTHPENYISNKDIWRESLQKAADAFFPAEESLAVETPAEPSVSEPVLTLEEQKMKWWLDYAEVIYRNCASYSISYEQIARLEEVAAYCNENSIELLFFVPPVHTTIFEHVIIPLGLEDELDEYKRLVSSFAPLYDFEYESQLSASDEFGDGFHFEGATWEEYWQAVFTGRSDQMYIWRDGKRGPA